MNANSTVPESPDEVDSTSSWREWWRELRFLIITYIVTALVASLFIAACGPGCCYVFYSIIAGVSGACMLRQSLPSRCICFGILLLSLFGMWHEKEARDTWRQYRLHRQIQDLEQKLEKIQTSVSVTEPKPTDITAGPHAASAIGHPGKIFTTKDGSTIYLKAFTIGGTNVPLTNIYVR